MSPGLTFSLLADKKKICDEEEKCSVELKSVRYRKQERSLEEDVEVRRGQDQGPVSLPLHWQGDLGLV